MQWHVLVPGAPPVALDLISRLLCVDPLQRLSADEALRHPFLAKYYQAEYETVAEQTLDDSYDAAGASLEELRGPLHVWWVFLVVKKLLFTLCVSFFFPPSFRRYHLRGHRRYPRRARLGGPCRS